MLQTLNFKSPKLFPVLEAVDGQHQSQQSNCERPEVFEFYQNVVDLQAEYNSSEGLGLLKSVQHSGPFIYFQESYNKYFALK